MLRVVIISITYFISLLFSSTVSFAQESDSVFLITNIRIVGNNKTKEYVIQRELTFAIGDTILKSLLDEELEKSKKNLNNTSLFNFVTIDHHPVTDMYTEVLIVVTERWYLWPYPILEVADPNFNTWWQTKDLSRINWGAMVMDRNFRGRKELLGVLLQLGYSKKFGAFYDIPYTEKHQNIGYGVYTSYVQNYEVIYSTENNKRLFTRPSGTSREEWYNAFYVKFRNKIFVSHQLIGSFQDVMVEDSVVFNNPKYFGDSTSRLKTFGVKYIFKSDHRDNKSYPLKGYFFRGDIEHYGLGLFSNKPYTQVMSEVKYFSELGSNFYWASSLKAKHSFQKVQPYFYQNMLGYNDNVRGYEYYVVDGRSAILFKSNVKYKLVSSGKKTLPLFNNPKISNFHYAFYLNAYADIGYVKDDIFTNNSLANDYMIGYGVGLDFVTYYDKVVRVEFSTNRLNEFGFFLHFVQPI